MTDAEDNDPKYYEYLQFDLPRYLDRHPDKKKLWEVMNDPKNLQTRDDLNKLLAPESGDESHSILPWLVMIEQKGFHEFLNEEYLNALADYMISRLSELQDGDPPIVVLELGAGNGRLSYFLQDKLEERKPGAFVVVATDSQKSGIKQVFPVEQLDFKDALQKFKPEVVVVSWMPDDFSSAIRNTASVKEYILIGETESCGDPWQTWGQLSEYDEEYERRKDLPKPYETDGFERKQLTELSKLQIARGDSRVSIGKETNSETNSFRRRPTNDMA